MLNLEPAAATLDAPPTFVDLRDFARDASLGVATGVQETEDRFLNFRRVLDWAPGPVTAGVITLEAGHGVVQSLAADEFIIVHEGQITLTQEDKALTLQPGQSAVIKQGATFTWSAQGPVLLIFTRYNRSQPGDGTIVPIKEDPVMGPSGGPAADLLTTPAPTCRNHTDYTSADGEFMCGTWDSTPYARRSMYYRHYELMYLLEGSVTFVDETGRSGTFSKGDIFLVEQGANCSWDSSVDVAKVYVIYRPK